MTVTYTHEVATGRGFGNFWRLLRRWRGSIYKVVLPELCVYAILFGGISLLYRLWIKKDKGHKEKFDMWVKYCADYAGVIPVSFVLGFYVAQIVTRWWSQFQCIPWPDAIAQLVASTYNGTDDESRLERRTIMRYVNLSFILTMCMISPQAKARFPTMDHLVDAGLMTAEEKAVFDRLNSRTDLPKYWIPLVWAGNIVYKARRAGKILEDLSMTHILLGLGRFRSNCGDLLGYDWVSIPLVYTQVVTLAVYLYFFAALFGKQFLTDKHELDLYVPVFLFLEFFFYVGWLKVAETLVNPFGEDDDDFEVNWLIDRDVIVSYIVVDYIFQDIPTLEKDQWWDDVFPAELPYTVAARKFQMESSFQGSATLQNIPMEGEQTLFVSKSEGVGSTLTATANRSRPLVPVPTEDVNKVMASLDAQQQQRTIQPTSQEGGARAVIDIESDSDGVDQGGDDNTTEPGGGTGNNPALTSIYRKKHRRPKKEN